MSLVRKVSWNFPGLETEEDPKGEAPRNFYRNKGFVEGELVMEYECPSQVFVLHSAN